MPVGSGYDDGMKRVMLLAAFLVAGASYLVSAEFDYYVLSLSYAPDFCTAGNGYKDPLECGRGRNLSFVVHGLWPQNERGRGPEHCGAARPVAARTVDAMLAYIPSRSLIQHEWKEHGVCSNLGADEFFAQVRRARDAYRYRAIWWRCGSRRSFRRNRSRQNSRPRIRDFHAARFMPRARADPLRGKHCRKCAYALRAI